MHESILSLSSAQPLSPRRRARTPAERGATPGASAHNSSAAPPCRAAAHSAGLKRSATVAQGSGIRSRDQSDDELETSAEAQARLKKLLDLNAKYPWIATEGGTPIEGGDGTVQPWHVKLVLTKEAWCIACKKLFSMRDPSNLGKHAKTEHHKDTWASHGARQRQKLLKIDSTLEPVAPTGEKLALLKELRVDLRTATGAFCVGAGIHALDRIW